MRRHITSYGCVRRAARWIARRNAAHVLPLALVLTVFLAYQVQNSLSPASRPLHPRTEIKTTCVIEDELRAINGVKSRTHGNLPAVYIEAPLAPKNGFAGHPAFAQGYHTDDQVYDFLAFLLHYTETSSSAL